MDNGREEPGQHALQQSLSDQCAKREESEAGMDILHGTDQGPRIRAAGGQQHNVYRDAVAEHSLRTGSEKPGRNEVDLLAEPIREFEGNGMLRCRESRSRVL